MKKLLLLFALGFAVLFLQAQSIERPKLVVGIVIDQMRWDFLYRYYNRYATDGGFHRLLSEGYSCENTMISYVPSITACGHSAIYTGSVPALHGIAGNDWEDRATQQIVYCTQDASEKTVGSQGNAGEMSPRNLLTTTVTDELRLATNFQSKVIGIALKDRGSILPAGHSANAAYWYDMQSGNWITSTYYMKELPKWVNDFNAKKLTDKYYDLNWNTLYPVNTYSQSQQYNTPSLKAQGTQRFPYNLQQYKGKNYGVLEATPYGNTMTVEFARAAITEEHLGSGAVTDFLTISFSSTDYVGHAYGPNSIEQEDTYLRLDRDLGELLSFLDSKIGKSQYLLFLSADHGAANAPWFLQEHNIPSGSVSIYLADSLNKALRAVYGRDSLVTNVINYQVFLNLPLISRAHLNKKEIINMILPVLQKIQGIDRAFDIEDIDHVPIPSLVREMVKNGYYPKRSGDIQIIYKPQWIEGFENSGTTHGVWNPYDTHIPLLWFGWHIKHGSTNHETHITDIAPTVAALLHIQMPSGCIGKVIEDVGH